MGHYKKAIEAFKKGGSENALHYLYENKLIDFEKMNQLMIDYVESRKEYFLYAGECHKLAQFNQSVMSIIEELKGGD